MNSNVKYSCFFKIGLNYFKSNPRVQACLPLFNRGCYCTSSIVGTRVYGNPLATLFTHYPIVWTVKSSVVGTRVVAML